MLTAYKATLAASQIDGPTLTSSAAFQSMLPSQVKGNCLLPAGFLQFVGQVLHVRAGGRITTGAAPGTVTLNINIGAANNPNFTSGAMTFVASQTNITWVADIVLTVRALDTASAVAGTVIGTGVFNAGVALIANGNIMMPATAPVAGGAFDNAAALQFDIGILSSALTTTWVCHQFQLDADL